jgi:hypothetical protein
MQSTGQRIGLASLGDAERGCSVARYDGLGLGARERRRQPTVVGAVNRKAGD